MEADDVVAAGADRFNLCAALGSGDDSVDVALAADSQVCRVRDRSDDAGDPADYVDELRIFFFLDNLLQPCLTFLTSA